MPEKTSTPSNLKKKKLKKVSQSDHRVLDALFNVALDLINRHEQNDILNSLLLQSADLLNAPCVSVDLLEGADTLVTHATTPNQPLKPGNRIQRGEDAPLSWEAIESRMPVKANDYSKRKNPRTAYRGFPIRAILIIPIIHRDQAIGAINFLRFDVGKAFSDVEIYIATQLAQAASLVLDNARVFADLKSELNERTKAETALQEAQAKIIENEKSLAELKVRHNLSRDLHDGIGQPLAYISMQSDIALGLLQQKDQAELEPMLLKLANAAQEANREIREYILGLRENTTSVLQQDFFSSLQQYCESIHKDYSFDIELHLPHILPDVLGSAIVEEQLTYIIREALNNARKHSGTSQASVTIEVNDDFVKAIIEDQGHGMGSTYRGPERRNSLHFGLGIMRSRAEDVGGSIDIDTSPTRGTRIIAELPRRLAEGMLTQFRILLADNHPLFIDGVSNMLMQYGAQVVGIAKDGIEVQEMALALKPDLILMDINMPRMNGLDATRKIKSEMPDIKIIMLTRSMDEENLFTALSAGAAGYLLKGMDADEFMTLLGEISLGEVDFSSEIAIKMLEIFTRPELQISSTQQPDELQSLTERQRDMLSLVAQGLTYKEVGQKLFLAERTIKFHMGTILKQLQLKGRRELIEFAKRNQQE